MPLLALLPLSPLPLLSLLANGTIHHLTSSADCFLSRLTQLNMATTTTTGTRYAAPLLLFLVYAAAAAADEGDNANPVQIRIACGSTRDLLVTNKKNSNNDDVAVVFVHDYGYTGGAGANGSVTSYAAPALRTLRVFTLADGPNNCYNLTVPPGPSRYSVRAFFGMLDDREPLFDVSVQGTPVASLEPGWSTRDSQAFIEVSLPVIAGADDYDFGSVALCVHSTGHGDPTIMSVEVLELHQAAYSAGTTASASASVMLRTVLRLNCGAADGQYGSISWGGDRFWSPDWAADKTLTSVLSTSRTIARADAAPNFYPQSIYQTASRTKAAGTDLTYDFQVDPVRRYSLWLHFAEIDTQVSAPGQRVFDVVVDGQVVFQGVDVVKMAGGTFSALVLNTTVDIIGRNLRISFRPRKLTAFVSAIEIFQVIPMENSTVPEQVWALQVMKKTLELPLRFGWNGDPCVPQQHPWSGIDCHFDNKKSKWFIDGLGLDNQGLKGFLTDDIANLQQLRSINFSGNSIQGSIPALLGTLTSLEYLDLSYNLLNGAIPESLGQLTNLKKLYLNGNLLTGRVPSALDSGPIRGASFNFSGNAGLCGVPGLPSCGPDLSSGSKAGIAIAVIIMVAVIGLCGLCMWKRQQNILRAKNAAREAAPYAKARTHFGKDVQMSKPVPPTATVAMTEDYYFRESPGVGPQLPPSSHPPSLI